MSASIRPISPPRPSSASVTATTVSSSSPPTTSRSTVFPSGSSRGGGGPSTTAPSSASSAHPPPPHPAPGPGVAPGIQAQEAQTHAHPHPHTHHQPHTLHPAQNRPQQAGAPPHPPPSSSAARAPASPTNPSYLPTEAEQEQIAQARTALVASIGNTLDHELQTRASLLHSNQAAIEKQERDVERALADLRREDDRLLKVLNNGSRQVKELGDVQNWAERLERDFLVLEETMRLVHEGDSGGESGSWTGSESGSWSGSERGSFVGDGDEGGDVRMADGDEDPDHGQVNENAVGKGKGKQPDGPSSTSAMDVDSAQDSLPHRTAGPEPSMLVDLVSSSNGATAPPQQSPTSTGWLRRFWWRS
ncbi:hypothetical protein INS49_010879 [Diaporthe citri]|uniref:uncharacterized protein n=1 Tax=Diaporthe citri TaxID=83186 RepID=UPI001C8219B8|nr:uncharacterized protein INS49_010879 [Diaporthe citri]KAG6359826.1 hypothetical protein INS49_010879 [Diaporthe citri]